MRTYYDDILSQYTAKLSRMGVLVSQSLGKAMNAFQDKQVELAHEIIAMDSQINQQHQAIEQEAFSIIALQQPVADDLRLIIAVMQASNDLERIADHATNIAQGVIRLEGNFQTIPELDGMISQLFTIVEAMITGAIDAFIIDDEDLARQIAQRDDEVDACLAEIHEHTIQYMKSDRQLVRSGADYLYIANSLERIGDYMTNICERVLFKASRSQESLN
ncbi:phosphate signaling complex protein PhoU [Ignavigranum ruoffiae]|uniref:phosphate signaling complex protein PhoU n=1 Tax=Ignavigranum ruoffiae TaxID=89093 RepID=UPI00235217AE|nr:phosphate signaling complex protein PhoU [Ignavigranum ruoffiae]